MNGTLGKRANFVKHVQDGRMSDHEYVIRQKSMERLSINYLEMKIRKERLGHTEDGLSDGTSCHMFSGINDKYAFDVSRRDH